MCGVCARHRVIAVATPRMTAAQTVRGQITALHPAMTL